MAFSKLGCQVMKELDNKGINVSGLPGIGLLNHKVQWFEYVSTSIQCLVFSLYVFVEQYRIFVVRIWVYNNPWFRKNKVYGSRSITGIRVLGSVLQSTCNIKQDYQSTTIYLEKVQSTCLVLACYTSLTFNHNRLLLDYLFPFPTSCLFCSHIISIYQYSTHTILFDTHFYLTYVLSKSNQRIESYAINK